MTPQQVQMSVAEGYSFVCAMCEHLYWGKERGLDECRAGHEGKTCGGPISGLGFPQYQGPLSRERIATHCFRCGQAASKVVEGNQGPGKTGVCKRHLPMLTRVMEEGADRWAPLEHAEVKR